MKKFLIFALILILGSFLLSGCSKNETDEEKEHAPDPDKRQVFLFVGRI